MPPLFKYGLFYTSLYACIDHELLSNLVYEAIRQRSDLMFHLPPVRRP